MEKDQPQPWELGDGVEALSVDEAYEAAIRQGPSRPKRQARGEAPGASRTARTPLRLNRPVTAVVLFAQPEMHLHHPGEIELSRGGADEGEGRGFDNLDMSASAERTIAVGNPGPDIVRWFVVELTSLGWADEGEGRLRRAEGETFFVRVDRDMGASVVAAHMSDPAYRRMQEEAEAVFHAGAPEGWSVVTLFYTVAPEAETRT